MNEAQKNSGNDIKRVLAEKGLDGGGESLIERMQNVTDSDVERELSKPAGGYNFDRLLTLLSPAAGKYLEQMAQLSRQLTIQRFGKTIKLYVPLYVSNFCNNSCLYCGFNTTNQFGRKRLTVDEAVKEAGLLASEGFSDILLVSSEDAGHIGVDYLAELAEKLRNRFASISVEIYQLNSAEYARLFAAGVSGVTIYQETYNRDVYAHYHPKGPKADYDRRLIAADSIGQGGGREIGIGALLGLADWRIETLALAEHGHYLMKKYWQSHISFSFPRIRPACQVERSKFSHLVNDKELVQMIVALRLCFADAGLVISTRESAHLRNHLINFGITRISAGSKTNPGGYSGASNSGEQFQIDDDRSASQIIEMIRNQGFEPVWKDWDAAFAGD